MPRITPIIKDSYLAMIENSVGTRMFCNFYVRVGKRKQNAVQGGKLSCAFFVSFILNNFGLIKESHLTVKSTINDIKRSGWTMIKRPRKGAVIIWEEKLYSDKNAHSHIGFYIGNKQAISNSTRSHKPVRHHWTFGPRGSKNYRKVIAIYWHPELN